MTWAKDKWTLMCCYVIHFSNNINSFIWRQFIRQLLYWIMIHIFLSFSLSRPTHDYNTKGSYFIFYLIYFLSYNIKGGQTKKCMRLRDSKIFFFLGLLKHQRIFSWTQNFSNYHGMDVISIVRPKQLTRKKMIRLV